MNFGSYKPGSLSETVLEFYTIIYTEVTPVADVVYFYCTRVAK